MSKKAEYDQKKQAKQVQRTAQAVDSENPTMVFELQPNALTALGLIISTQLSITSSHMNFLRDNNLAIPEPVMCRFLVDTGATRSMVKHSFAEKAGLKLISENTPVHGVGVDTTGKTYLGRIAFLIKSRVSEGAMHQTWVDAQIISGTLHDSEFLDGLIGRDVLQHFDLRINGKTGRSTMVYLKNGK